MRLLGFVFLALCAIFYWLGATHWRVEGAALTMSALFGLLSLIALSHPKKVQ